VAWATISVYCSWLQGGVEFGMLQISDDLIWTPLLDFSSSMALSKHFLILSIIPKYNNIISLHIFLIIKGI
jgi:hypothetical protein